VFRSLALFDSASTCLSRARVLIERSAAANPPLRAEWMVGMANLAREMGDRARARSYADSALLLRRTHLSPANPRIAENLQLLGMIERDLGNLDSARVLLQSGLEVLEGQSGNRGTRAALLNSLGVLERQTARPAEAKRRFEQVVAPGPGAASVPWRVRALALRNLGSTTRRGDS
jgi:tetratricopeptide (TPR) repeat protein